MPLGPDPAYQNPALAFGLQTWAGDPALFTTAQAPTAGTIYGTAIYLKAGQPINNLLYSVNVAGAGTVPTDIRVGLASLTQVIALSANRNADAGWTTANQIFSFPVATPAAAPASGLYYAMFLQVAAWGTTQMTLNRGGSVPNVNPTPANQLGQVTFGTSQTVIPNVGSSPGTASATGSFRFWAGVS